MSDTTHRELEGKVIVLTGAGRGIGEAIARLAAQKGARLALCARTTQELDQVAASIRAAGGDVLALAGDVSEEAFVDGLFQQALQRWGRVDALVNNAAIIAVKPFIELDSATWDRVIAVNLRGPFLCSRAAFAAMGVQGGVIVNVSSLSGVRGPEKFPGFSAYIASKYGLLGLTDSLAVEGRPHGIRCNAVSLGAVETRMLKEAAPQLRSSTTVEQVAETVCWLLGERASHLNGANIEVFSNA